MESSQIVLVRTFFSGICLFRFVLRRICHGRSEKFSLLAMKRLSLRHPSFCISISFTILKSFAISFNPENSIFEAGKV